MNLFFFWPVLKARRERLRSVRVVMTLVPMMKVVLLSGGGPRM